MILHIFVANVKMDYIMKKILFLMAAALSFVFISCSDDKDEPETPDEYEYVDLGLPSGTLWATCNVGAKAPEEYGYYFAWGETSPKRDYTYETYKWCNGNMVTLTKYNSSYEYGTVDLKFVLDDEDDAAYVNWGPSWRMPTTEQQSELLHECSWEWTTRKGVNGRLATGPNGNTIFLPAAGYCSGSSNNSAGKRGVYWSSAPDHAMPYTAHVLHFDSGDFDAGDKIDIWWGFYGRPGGASVRAVRAPQN